MHLSVLEFGVLFTTCVLVHVHDCITALFCWLRETKKPVFLPKQWFDDIFPIMLSPIYSD